MLLHTYIWHDTASPIITDMYFDIVLIYVILGGVSDLSYSRWGVSDPHIFRDGKRRKINLIFHVLVVPYQMFTLCSMNLKSCISIFSYAHISRWGSRWLWQKRDASHWPKNQSHFPCSRRALFWEHGCRRERSEVKKGAGEGERGERQSGQERGGWE